MPISRAWLAAPILALAACGAPAERSPPDGAPANRTAPAAATPVSASPTLAAPQGLAPATATATAGTSAAPLSCADEIGPEPAAARVAVCRAVSPATHPPCNAANSCAMIEDEIARSCALFEGKGPRMAGCVPAPTSMAAAAAVVRRYYDAINARDYQTAWAQWGENGRPGQTFAGFEAGFAHTRSTRVAIGRLEPGDGGAGSIYQPVPVTVEATLDDGTRQRFSGTYIVRRVNGVDGASPAQLRWHLDSAHLKPAPR